MRTRLLLVILLLLFSATNAPANGFGLFRRPVEVRYSSYYVPAYYYYAAPVYSPVYYPVVSAPTISAPIISAPVFPAAPLAVPRAAPASSSGEPPLAGRRPAVGTESSTEGARTAMRPGDSFYTLLPGPAGMDRADERCSVAFWNLTGRAISLKVDGRDYSLAVGRSLTVELPRAFAWNVSGREVEATRIPPAHASAEVLIRR